MLVIDPSKFGPIGVAFDLDGIGSDYRHWLFGKCSLRQMLYLKTVFLVISPLVFDDQCMHG